MRSSPIGQLGIRGLRGVTLEVEQSLTVGAGVPATLRIFGHEVDGVTHYGAVIAPDNLAPGSTPVLVYSHGGG